MNIKRTAALLAAAAIAALATATAGAATSTAAGIEHWTVESTDPVSATAVLIDRGPLMVGGTIKPADRPRHTAGRDADALPQAVMGYAG